MKIKRLVIENFKSIERIELIEPNPFTVFVGPNGSGKSNIFEALEFVNLRDKLDSVLSLFGGPQNLLRRQNRSADFGFNCTFNELESRIGFSYAAHYPTNNDHRQHKPTADYLEYKQFFNTFTRLFVRNKRLEKLNLNDNQRLSLSADNLEKVLKRVLSDNILKNEIFEWLELFIPEFKAVEIDERDELHWFEEFAPNYFIKELISDGTYNILAMLTAVYQSDDKPQFLCIEEPENGLHPQVAGELVDFFRIMCEERGHHIWLNTHSQSMIARLRPEEMVIVDKKKGATRIKQISKEDFKNWRMDEALLTNAFGGGLPW
ncbi:AAA family ATPase [Larkinella humicola]|uniref:AAA family ATPase n=1 Tax=Larkinella humicola TaxID=2607654 RepID=A0A5N1JP86_9BACT|nr:AAA family ATPase [Larkinella humicola]KAA9357436.1 AAA family ATPase [Larkinella humicola]